MGDLGGSRPVPACPNRSSLARSSVERGGRSLAAQSREDPGRLIFPTHTASQLGLAQLEQLPQAGDVVIDGYQFVIGAIRRIAEGEAGDRQHKA